jgi:SpoVK/Ycf46/Vps4 family AAA+-type ATPase
MSPGVLDVIAKEKAKVVRKVEGLEFIPWERITPEEQIGGFTALRKWLKIRGRAYSRHAQALGMELPRGIVLIGPPGTGKTMVAKATAKILGLDLITLDIGSMYDKYVGGSEGKIRKALNMVKAMPNALLLVD